MERNRTGEIALSAALGFAAGALLAAPARKIAMQGVEAISTRDWADALTLEHRAVQKTFDALLATSERDAGKRRHLLTTIDHALTKHALQEEKVIYPALRRMNEQQAQHLFSEHADVKSLISELQYELDPKGPAWIGRAQELRNMLDEHMREEEDDIFPMFREQMSAEQNAMLTRHMHMQGMQLV